MHFRFILPLLIALSAFAQTSAIRGIVTDESGAVVPGAKITITGPGKMVKSAASGIDGSYSVTGLPLGNYDITAAAPDLALPLPAHVSLAGATQTVNLRLKVASTVQQVTVEENTGPVVTSDPANNASALVLRGEDLQALSDDPDDLQADLQALAGPSAGPNGGAIYIDGFSGGQLPSKESIREIRINQNPFSPEYDKLGFGRIEIFTKPGTDKFHGTVLYNFGSDALNSRNPYAAMKAPFLLQETGGNIGGPLGKRASFFLDFRRDGVDNGAIINGTTVDPVTLRIVNPYTQTFTVPQARFSLTPRLDYQLNTNNTLVFRYQFGKSEVDDSGIGGFNLAERAYRTALTTQTAQATETAVFGTTVNELRFQYFRTGTDLLAKNNTPAIQVLNAFTGGGAQVGHSTDLQNYYELQNYVSVARKAHSWRFGVRLREQSDNSVSPQNFGGTFTFAGGGGLTSIQQYQLALMHTPGFGPTQFTINNGNPKVTANQFDASIFAGDDWRIRSNMTLSLGLRYETQSNIHDWTDIAPRVGLAWAPGKAAKGRPKTVIRAGYGAFYDRFGLANTLTALRYNGSLVQQYVVSNPAFFPVIPPIASLNAMVANQVTQKVSSSLRAPYIMQSAASVERQLPHNTTVAITYANSHGLHLLRSSVLNPGTAQQTYLMESSGLYNQNQLIVNVNSRLNSNVTLFGNYMWNHALSNTDGLSTFPANPYSSAGEYGPAATDIHNRMALGGSVTMRWNIRVNPFVIVDSGPPFDITAGRDIYGDTLFNARPGFATDPNKPGVVRTPYGLLDPNPTPDERLVPRNYGRGPGSVLVNLRLTKIFGFGPVREGGSGAPGPQGGGDMRRAAGGSPFGGGMGGMFGGTSVNRRFNLSLGLQVRNILNHNNPGPIIGNITSPLFGLANQPAGGFGGGGFSESANNRRLEFQLRLTF